MPLVVGVAGIDVTGSFARPSPRVNLSIHSSPNACRAARSLVSGALREPQLDVEEGEVAGVPQFHPQPAVVEVREGEQKLGEGAMLVAEELSEAVGERACGRHAPIVSRTFWLSGDAPGCPQRREREEGTPRRSDAAPRARMARAGAHSGHTEGASQRNVKPSWARQALRTYPTEKAGFPHKG